MACLPVIAGGDTAEVFHAAEEIFDFVPFRGMTVSSPNLRAQRGYSVMEVTIMTG